MQLVSTQTLKILIIGLTVLVFSLIVYKFEGIGIAGLIVIPVGVFGLIYLMAHPHRALDLALVCSFLAIGVIRYVGNIPLGLTVDFALVFAIVIAVFHRTLKTDFSKLKNGLMLVTVVWMVFCIAEFFNPEAVSVMAWVYAVRGLALYMMLVIPLTLLYANRLKDLDRFIKIVIFLSFLAALWGMKQFVLGPDYAESAWLREGKNMSTHVLFGELRIFSFFSDAGQFGAGIAQAGVITTIIALGPFSNKTRIIAVFFAIVFFLMMILSGTRGALIVPVAGMLSYLFASRNFRLLTLGLIFMAGVFAFLQFTTIGHDIYQIRRMRTALDPNDASLQVRLANRVIIDDYLKDKPFGGGIGTSGSWGQRFSPDTLLADTPNDGWYVRVKAETGVVGFYLHLGILLFIGGAGLSKSMRVKDEKLRQKLLALFAGYVGIAAASYGNPLLGQIPTGIILYMSWAYLFLAHDLDQEILVHTKSEQP